MGHCFLKRITLGCLIQSDSAQQSILICLHTLLYLHLNLSYCCTVVSYIVSTEKKLKLKQHSTIYIERIQIGWKIIH